MPMRRTIGISLAVLMVSAGASAKTPDRNPSHHPGQPHGKSVKTEWRHGDPRFRTCKAVHHSHRRAHAAVRHRYADPQQDSESATNSGGPADAYIGPVQAIGRPEIGNAAWYNWVGGRTSSGEILDSVTATAAHRSLPLASYARVTNLDNGRSMIVKINDRGPWSRRFIIDLSPRAADELNVKHAGVAAVMVEPVMPGDSSPAAGTPTVAALLSYAGSASQ